MPARHKHFPLLRTFVNNSRKQFYNIGTRSIAVCQRLQMKKVGMTEEWYNQQKIEFILDLE
jgi:hypothetical protein